MQIIKITTTTCNLPKLTITDKKPHQLSTTFSPFGKILCKSAIIQASIPKNTAITFALTFSQRVSLLSKCCTKTLNSEIKFLCVFLIFKYFLQSESSPSKFVQLQIEPQGRAFIVRYSYVAHSTRFCSKFLDNKIKFSQKKSIF